MKDIFYVSVLWFVEMRLDTIQRNLLFLRLKNEDDTFISHLGEGILWRR